MSSIEALCDSLNDELVPRVSKKAYEKEWDKFNQFLEDHNVQEIDETNLLAFFASQAKASYAPTTIRRSASMLKKMCIVKDKIISENTWEKVNSWINNLTKDHVPAAAAVFTREELDKYLGSLTVEDPLQLQEMAFILVAFMGGIRRTENYNLRWEDFEFHESKHEIFVRVQQTKGNLKGRSFAITDEVFFDVLTKYKNSIIQKSKHKKAEGFFYRLWNKPAKVWNSNRRGKNWFQKIPRKIALFLKKNDPSKFTHHSFRKTMATELAGAGASEPLCQASGGWKSSKSLSTYIIDTDHQKRKIAKMLDSTSTIKKSPHITAPEPSDTPKRAAGSLMHGANGTIVQATNMGSMGAWNLQSCKVEIHHHVHESPLKKIKSSDEVPNVKIALEDK